jgi:hypothetical protein
VKATYTLRLPIVSGRCVRIGPRDWSEGTGTCSVGSVVKMMPDAGDASGIWLISPPMSAVRKPKLFPSDTVCAEELENVKPEGVTVPGIKQLSLPEEAELAQLIWAKLAGEVASIKNRRKCNFRVLMRFTFWVRLVRELRKLICAAPGLAKPPVLRKGSGYFTEYGTETVTVVKLPPLGVIVTVSVPLAAVVGGTGAPGTLGTENWLQADIQPRHAQSSSTRAKACRGPGKTISRRRAHTSPNRTNGITAAYKRPRTVALRGCPKGGPSSWAAVAGATMESVKVTLVVPEGSAETGFKGEKLQLALLSPAKLEQAKLKVAPSPGMGPCRSIVVWAEVCAPMAIESSCAAPGSTPALSGTMVMLEEPDLLKSA